MTKLQEIANLTALEMDIIQFGKIGMQKELTYEYDFKLIPYPFPTKKDENRLKKFHFEELQDKYTYGWYIAEETLEEQIKSIEKFKLYIMDNYKED